MGRSMWFWCGGLGGVGGVGVSGPGGFGVVVHVVGEWGGPGGVGVSVFHGFAMGVVISSITVICEIENGDDWEAVDKSVYNLWITFLCLDV